MNNSVSFGRKIPVVKCTVVDKAKNKPVSATIYCYDCADKQDYKEIQALPDVFYYKQEFTDGMRQKYYNSVFGEEDENQFYSLETKDGNILGIAKIHFMSMLNKGKNIILDLLQSNTGSNYKYVGQSLLAGLCSKADEENLTDSIIVLYPAESAVDFYSEKCGFEKAFGEALILQEKKFSGFIESTRKKTGGKIENI